MIIWNWVYVYTEGITSLVITLETNQSAYMHVKIVCCDLLHL